MSGFTHSSWSAGRQETFWIDGIVRWENNCERYASLSCVKMILPWSTASMLFCRSELKSAIICRDLSRAVSQADHHQRSPVIRRDESTTRSRRLLCSAPQSRLTSKTFQTLGLDWHPTGRLDAQTRSFCLSSGPSIFLFTKHTHASECHVLADAFCILADYADLIASTTCEENHAIYRELVAMRYSPVTVSKRRAGLGKSLRTCSMRR